MDELAFGVKIIKRKEDLLKSALQKILAKPMCRIKIQQISKAPPHRFLDKTVMLTSLMSAPLMRYRECI
mgnify:CR=1 FL=1